MEKIDLMIVLPTQYNEIIDLTAYDYVPDTPNEALQETIQEKTRIFNNSTLPLFDNYNNAFNCIALSKNESWNSINPELFTPVPGNRLNTGKPLIKMKNRLSPKR